MTQPPGYGPPHPIRPPAPQYQPPAPHYGPYPPPPVYYYWPGPPPPPVSPAGVPLADFWMRLVAYIIDVVLLSVAIFVLSIPGIVVVFRRIDDVALYSDTDPTPVFTHFFVPFLLLELGIIILGMIVYYLYDVEFMHRTGQTIGKKAMKIRVVPLDPALTLTRGMAFRRYLVQYVCGSVVPFFNYLDGLWQLWDKPYQQTLHDKAAQTVVVKVSA